MGATDFLEFGPFRADTRRRLLLRGDDVIPLPAKAFDVLLVLLRAPGQTVPKDQFMKAVWPDTFVEEGNLTQMISLLRKALGDSESGRPLIITAPGQGYRFVGELTGAGQAIPPGRRPWMVAAAAGIVMAFLATYWLLDKRAGQTISAIAVLPFADVSPKRDLDYFCDGVADEIIEALSQIPGLRVTARNSAFRFKNKNEDARTIGSKLGVEAVLEGTVRRDGNRLRVTAELVSAKNGYRLWAESYDRDERDVFAVQRAISRSVAEALRIRAGDNYYAPPRYTADVGVYNLYLKGRSTLFRDPLQAVAYFNRALESNRNYAPAYAGLADAYMWQSAINPNETLPKAKEAMETALRLDDRLAEAHFSKAAFLARDWDWRGAIAETERAIQLAPSFGPALWKKGDLLLGAGHEQEARAAYQRAEAIDPMTPNLFGFKITSLLGMRRFDEMIKLAKQNPDANSSTYFLGRAYAEKGMIPEGMAQMELAWSRAKEQGRGGQGFGALASLYMRAGRRPDAMKLLGEVQALAKRRYVHPSSMSMLCIALGDFDEAFRWLERACEEHDAMLCWLKRDTGWDPVRNDPRFKALLKKVHLE